mmetsp:Transcript_9347/g.13912  ORF Transcript_9347/g.13912 Transcript_9347/m.13912 type:complete len:470 (+) Transcript_9347:1264-2673(+)
MAEKQTYRKKVALPSDKDETQVKVKPRKKPNFNQKPAEVKLNAAAILREEARLKKEEEAERKRLESFMIDMRDDSQYEKWRSEMRAKDELERMEQLQMRKIEMELAREEAIEAMQQKHQENQLLAAKLREEAKDKAFEKELNYQKELEEKKSKASDLYEARANMQVEKEKVKNQKKQVKEELQKEIQAAIERRKEEEAIEKAKRDELINQIRELESQRTNKSKEFDPNEVVGHGLLEEMSLAQLKEKLEERKKLFQEEAEKKREENIRNKELKSQELMDKASRIASLREQQSRLKEEQRKKKQEQEDKKKQLQQEIREKGMLTAYERINAKKQARLKEQKKLQKELKEIRLKRQYLNANQALVEEKAWKEQEAGAEREAKQRQAQALVDQERAEKIKLSETNLRSKAAKELANSKKEVVQNFQKNLAEGHEENELLAREDRKDKQTKYNKQRQFEISQKQKTQGPHNKK